jgi:ribonuclease I
MTMIFLLDPRKAGTKLDYDEFCDALRRKTVVDEEARIEALSRLEKALPSLMLKEGAFLKHGYTVSEFTAREYIRDQIKVCRMLAKPLSI